MKKVLFKLNYFALAGKSALVKIGVNNVQGLNEANITINGETIDVTTFLSGGWMEKIQGLKSAEISLSGFYLNGDINGQDVLQDNLLTGTPVTMSVLNDGTNGWTGSFLVSSLEMNATPSGAVETSISLESTGAVTKTP